MRFPLAILLTIVASYTLGFYLTVPANSEVRFWREVVKRRDAEIAAVRMNQPGTPIIFFTGGSSCAFSIDPKIIEPICGLPSFNLGLPVAAGGEYLIHQALAHTQAGDVLVLCLEPDLLTMDASITSPSKFSLALAAEAGQPWDAAGGDTFGKTTTLRDYLNLSRPGAGHLATLLGKSITSRGYRYTAADIRFRGRIATPIHDDLIPTGPSASPQLSTEGKLLLKTLSKEASRRKIQVVYSMPWLLTEADSIARNRINNRRITEDISSFIPAIDDGYAGAMSDTVLFADTALHLSDKGSTIRSRALGEALKEWLNK